MGRVWTREFVARRIDRCYLIAGWTKVADKKRRYLALARRYRMLLANTTISVLSVQHVWNDTPATA